MGESYPNDFRAKRLQKLLVTYHNLEAEGVAAGTPLDVAITTVLIDALHLAKTKEEELNVMRCAEDAVKSIPQPSE